jgi:hypothetical protein
MSTELNAVLEVSPVVASLARSIEKGGIVELNGLVGPSDPEKLRLYRSLELSYYLEMPREAILHAERIGDGKGGKVRVYVLKSTHITIVRVSSEATTAGNFAAQAQSPGGGTPGLKCDTLQTNAAVFDAILAVAKASDSVLHTNLAGDSRIQNIQKQAGETHSAIGALCGGEPA